MPRVGVLLAGCGVQDGSEVYESVLTILALERAGATVMAMAPDIEQSVVFNHYKGQEERTGELGGRKRDVLAESARIVRGKIVSTREVSAHDLDALIIPGGYGVVKNLCTYAREGEDATVSADVERLIKEVAALGKPIGAICAAPILVALVLRDKHPSLTIGNDGSTALSLTRLGIQHHITGVEDIHEDSKNSIVSTAAFMMAQSASEAEPGITKLVNRVLEMAKTMGAV